MKKAYILLTDGVEEMEAIAPIDLLSRAQVEVTQVSATKNLLVTGRSGITVQAEKTFEQIKDGEPADLLILPGGPGHKSLRKNNEVSRWIQKHAQASKYVAAICAAPVLLKDAGVLPENYTAHMSMIDEMPEIQKDKAVVIDGKYITSRGAGTATQFGLTLVSLLCGKETERDISDSIHWGL
jgi:4-methyl-5(b-hydroxyethyl)-thiazole monophosphate biosynthesis